MSMFHADDYHFSLSENHIAAVPALNRHDSKLLIITKTGGRPSHSNFFNLDHVLYPGDLLVLNNCKVVPARLRAIRETGGIIELLILRKLSDGSWRCLVRPRRRVSVGDRLLVQSSKTEITVRSINDDGSATIFFHLLDDIYPLLHKHGTIPIPPHLQQVREKSSIFYDDSSRYQTIFARKKGAVAAPTAGLHFTDDLFMKLTDIGVSFSFLTLYVGWGTFAPVGKKNLQDIHLDQEEYELPSVTIQKIIKTKEQGGRVIAVGTTVARTLENVLSASAPYSSRGAVDLFISPGYEFKSIDGIITNFHLPCSSLFMLISAFIGRERLRMVYREAICRSYRFYSYGDAMIIL